MNAMSRAKEVKAYAVLYKPGNYIVKYTCGSKNYAEACVLNSNYKVIRVSIKEIK